MSHPTHDVFLSFRGEDTRDTFTSHLHAELCRQNIETFIDDRLGRGEEISPALCKAIEESAIYVVILSQHYASSTGCLDELTKILECKERYGREVIPVFYNVDPSNVSHQRQSYADDFVKHHLRFGDKVDAWKVALTKVANLSGWDSQKIRWMQRSLMTVPPLLVVSSAILIRLSFSPLASLRTSVWNRPWQSCWRLGGVFCWQGLSRSITL